MTMTIVTQIILTILIVFFLGVLIMFYLIQSNEESSKKKISNITTFFNICVKATYDIMIDKLPTEESDQLVDDQPISEYYFRIIAYVIYILPTIKRKSDIDYAIKELASTPFFASYETDLKSNIKHMYEDIDLIASKLSYLIEKSSKEYYILPYDIKQKVNAQLASSLYRKAADLPDIDSKHDEIWMAFLSTDVAMSKYMKK
ncbi:MAG: hypothetical protein HFE63_01530 [Clostridiales bacterium]|nr:hypothetical protein [Clostridiales bacterium]